MPVCPSIQAADCCRLCHSDGKSLVQQEGDRYTVRLLHVTRIRRVLFPPEASETSPPHNRCYGSVRNVRYRNLHLPARLTHECHPQALGQCLATK